MHEHKDNVSREMKILRMNDKEMLEIKNTVREMKNAFDGFISSLAMAKARTLNFRISQ